MHARVLKIILMALTSIVMAACGSKPVATGPKPVVKTIAIVSAVGPQGWTVQNLSAVPFLVPIASVGYAQSNNQRSALLSSSLSAYRLDDTFTNAVADALREKGYEVQILKDVKRREGRPNKLETDLASVPATADAVMQLALDDVGLESPRTTTDFLPRMNVWVSSYVRGNESYPFDAYLYYGIDAGEPKPDRIPHDPKHVYASFDGVMADLGAVRQRFDAAALLLARRIADRADAAFR